MDNNLNNGQMVSPQQPSTNKSNKGIMILLVVIILLLCAALAYVLFIKDNNFAKKEEEETNTEEKAEETTTKVKMVTDSNNNGKYDTGDEVSIGDEHFYVISNDGTKVSLFAKYNLAKDGESYKQGENSITTAFAKTAYWAGSQGDNGTLLNSKYKVEGQMPAITGDVGYIVNVYDSNSLLYEPIEAYVKTLNISDATARPISYTELYNLGCDTEESDSYDNCAKAPSFVSSTAYWTETAYVITYDEGSTDYYLYNTMVFILDKRLVDGNDVLSARTRNPITETSTLGIRPVVELSINDFE